MSAHDVACRLFDEPLLTDCNVVLFEDDRTGEELFPLAVLRPSWEIRCGAGCTRHWFMALKIPGMALLTKPRSGMEDMSQLLAGRKNDPLDPELDTLFLNGRVLALYRDSELSDDMPDTLVDNEGRLLFARRRGPAVQELVALPTSEMVQRLLDGGEPSPVPDGWTLLYARYAWDYLLANARIMERQFTVRGKAVTEILGAHVLRELPPCVHITDKGTGHPVFVHATAKLHPAVVISNARGPVWIGPNVEIEAHSFLEGPVYVGPHCRVKAGARLYGPTVLGPHCRVGGEITASILQGYTNKQHDGFLGHSHLGQWVNLGADTCTSNLRNDYGLVKVHVAGHVVDTGQQYMGLLCGDHTKTGINTMFNTGSVVGVAANVFGGGYPPRFIPSFGWGGAAKLTTGELDRILETARTVMSRRECTLSDAEEALLRRHYAETVKG